jgi:hypothetical protein
MGKKMGPAPNIAVWGGYGGPAPNIASLLSMLQNIHLADGKDQRTMLNGAKFSTTAYDTLQESQHDALTMHIWDSRLPGKIQISGWLFHLDRLNTRANHQCKTIVQSPSCPRYPNTPEDRHHLFFACPAALAIWQSAYLDHLLILP